jgi:hypothetical protein
LPVSGIDQTMRGDIITVSEQTQHRFPYTKR